MARARRRTLQQRQHALRLTAAIVVMGMLLTLIAFAAVALR